MESIDYNCYPESTVIKMKPTFTPLLRLGALFAFFLTFSTLSAQVGINTTTPADGTMLDVTATDKGILIPRVALTSRAVSAPVTPEPVQGVLVFNTNTAGTDPNDVEPGFYWWDGVQWVALEDVDEDDWEILGNTGTDQDVNYIGTTDNTGLTMRTNDTERFRVTNRGSGQVVGMQDGSPSNPFYSFSSDPSVGMWTSGTGELDFSINGYRYININGNASGSQRGEVTMNPGEFDIDFIVQTDNSNASLFVNGENDNVGLGTTLPNTSAQLEMGDPDRGLLINRVNLTATNNAAPVTSPATGLLVYNLANTGTGATDVSPGFYYWDGSEWVALDGTNGNDWSVDGNAGTTAGTHYVGTSDDEDLVIARQGTEEMRILGDQVSINESAPLAGDRFTVQTDASEYGINSYANNGGIGIYTEGAAFGTYSISTNTGPALGARNVSSGLGAIITGQNQLFGSLANSAYTSIGLNYGGVGLGRAGTATGLSGTGNSGTTVRTLTNGSGVSGNGDTGVYGISEDASDNGTGMIAVSSLNSAITTNPTGSGLAASGLSLGVFGYAGNGDNAAANEGNSGAEFVLDGDNDPTTNNSNEESTRARAILAGYNDVTPDGSLSNQESYFGGYFSGGNEYANANSYAYVGMKYNIGNNTGGGSGNNNGQSGTDYKIIGTGSVSTMVRAQDNSMRVMYAPEAPEIVFQDFGVGQLSGGRARIDLDPILANAIYVDDQHPIKVYVTLEGDCNGVFVTDKSASGFTVKELAGGTSNAKFSWQIVANRADTKDRSGRVVSKHVGMRFPVGPRALKPEYTKKESTTQELQVDNSPQTQVKSTTTSVSAKPTKVK